MSHDRDAPVCLQPVHEGEIVAPLAIGRRDLFTMDREKLAAAVYRRGSLDAREAREGRRGEVPRRQ
jgi:hypothetical protein